VPGFLYAIVELQKSYDKGEELFRTNFASIAVELTHSIIKEGISKYEALTKNKIILDKLPPDFRLVYYFHKSEYLGGAHGLAGNISVLLSAMKYNDFGADTLNMVALIRASIHFLMQHFINGNFATKAGSTSIRLVHFCHGASGVVTALAKFTEMFPEMGVTMGIKDVLEVALGHIWKYGVLKKGFGLCHGISGNAYAFISPSIQQVLHDRTAELLKKAQFFALLHEEPDVLG
jgi:lantibiotic modifying enzyme